MNIKEKEFMKIKVGHKTYEIVYYERKGLWYISIDGRETLYDENRAWITFKTEKEAETYLEQKYGTYRKVP